MKLSGANMERDRTVGELRKNSWDRQNKRVWKTMEEDMTDNPKKGMHRTGQREERADESLSSSTARQL